MPPGIPYHIDFTDGSLPGKVPFTIQPNTTDGPLSPITNVPDLNATQFHTSITLPGVGLIQYGERIEESLVHMLENFASNGKPPVAPTMGQLWFDFAVKKMKMYITDGNAGTWVQLSDDLSISDLIKDALNKKVSKSGDTMTGPLVLSADPSADAHAATKHYVDVRINTIALTPGAQGPQGIQGIQGIKGETGSQGPVGPQGNTGPQGPQGQKGDKGDRGDNGVQGAQGPQGNTGPQGPQGWQGPQGPAGTPASISLDANGYANIGGFIIQWGFLFNQGVRHTLIAFPIAFPNTCVAVVSNYDTRDVSGDYRSAMRNGNATAWIPTDQNNTLWIALGF
jgi:hypothetical protein